MAGHDRRSVTIGQGMVAIAVGALAIALLANPSSAGAVSVVLGLAGIAFLVVVVVVAIVDLWLGIRCPQCGQWAMARTSVVSFRDRYYRCNACRVRCRRGFLSGWEDATGPEFDPMFAKKRPENPWTAAPGLEDEDLTWSKTHVHLLLNKKRRNPNPPEQGTSPKDP